MHCVSCLETSGKAGQHIAGVPVHYFETIMHCIQATLAAQYSCSCHNAPCNRSHPLIPDTAQQLADQETQPYFASCPKTSQPSVSVTSYCQTDCASMLSSPASMTAGRLRSLLLLTWQRTTTCWSGWSAISCIMESSSLTGASKSYSLPYSLRRYGTLTCRCNSTSMGPQQNLLLDALELTEQGLFAVSTEGSEAGRWRAALVNRANRRRLWCWVHEEAQDYTNPKCHTLRPKGLDDLIESRTQCGWAMFSGAQSQS